MKLIPQGHRYELRAHIQTMGASTQTSTQLLLPSIINPTMTGALKRFFPLLLLILLISEGLQLLLFTEPSSWAKLSFPGL